MHEYAQSEQINELIAALAKAVLEYKPVHRESENPYSNSSYADLATLIAATQSALANNGLVITQWPIVDNNEHEAGVISELAHSSGQWKRISFVLPANGKAKDGALKYDAQTCSAAITYARRVSYQAIVCVAGDTEDDANSIGEAAAGSTQAAQAVAQRKIAEHKAKEAATSRSSKNVRD
jgi:hypothetical protein